MSLSKIVKLLLTTAWFALSIYLLVSVSSEKIEQGQTELGVKALLLALGFLTVYFIILFYALKVPFMVSLSDNISSFFKRLIDMLITSVKAALSAITIIAFIIAFFGVLLAYSALLVIGVYIFVGGWAIIILYHVIRFFFFSRDK